VAGDSYTCAEATSNRAYCWGSNLEGQFGNGTRSQSLAPVAAGGGLLFTQLTAGESHTCGRTAAGIAYCWGRNRWGQLGDDTEVSRLTPVHVQGPS
jgi:alpha-tubulin suppressor-like RCC1 family protein